MAAIMARRIDNRSAQMRATTTANKVHTSDTCFNDEGKAEKVSQLLAKKEQSGKTFTEIANDIGLTNAFTANLFFRNAKLSDKAEPKLKRSVPTLSDEDIAEMKLAPMRDWHDSVLREPNTYRLYEAIATYSKSIKSIVNEEIGDGIMSAIDFYCSVERITGASGEPRVLIKFNGKHLPHIDQEQANDTS